MTLGEGRGCSSRFRLLRLEQKQINACPTKLLQFGVARAPTQACTVLLCALLLVWCILGYCYYLNMHALRPGILRPLLMQSETRIEKFSFRSVIIPTGLRIATLFIVRIEYAVFVLLLETGRRLM